jgi:hypothetical protein
MELATAALEAEALANRVKTETMQALSHDLRTPLQASDVYYIYLAYMQLTYAQYFTCFCLILQENVASLDYLTMRYDSV